jgi:hypothetical protein
MHDEASEERRARLRRLRWRMRGAWLWPTFAGVTLGDALLLHWLPLAGDGTGFIPALLLAACLNLIGVAVLGGLGGVLLRRRRPDLPQVVAQDYAGTAVVLAVAGVFLAVGLVHRPEVADDRAAFAAQSAAVRRWVAAFGDPLTRAHVDRADTLRLDEDLYRTCIPQIDPRRWLCVYVDTSAAPPAVRRDANRESNASLNRPGGFR